VCQIADAMSKLTTVQVGYQVYVVEGGEEFGAVREVTPHELVVYVENAGDFRIGGDAVKSVHDGKVVLDAGRLPPSLRDAIAHAHDREEPHV
jgi:hypothetical protein